MRGLRIAITLLSPLFFVMPCCATDHPAHKLAGSWEADDGTIFIFREDGTFIGRDYINRRIFGSWVALDPERIGFQSLMHAGVYLPQYAEVTPRGMRYAYSDGSRFVDAVAMDPSQALGLVLAARLNIKDPR